MLPDDLNKWSKQQFEEAMELFKKSAKLDNYEKSPVKKEKRPERYTTINKDDVTDLKILLGTCDSIDEFLRKV